MSQRDTVYAVYRARVWQCWVAYIAQGGWPWLVLEPTSRSKYAPPTIFSARGVPIFATRKAAEDAARLERVRLALAGERP